MENQTMMLQHRKVCPTAVSPVSPVSLFRQQALPQLLSTPRHTTRRKRRLGPRRKSRTELSQRQLKCCHPIRQVNNKPIRTRQGQDILMTFMIIDRLELGWAATDQSSQSTPSWAHPDWLTRHSLLSAAHSLEVKQVAAGHLQGGVSEWHRGRHHGHTECWQWWELWSGAEEQHGQCEGRGGQVHGPQVCWKVGTRQELQPDHHHPCFSSPGIHRQYHTRVSSSKVRQPSTANVSKSRWMVLEILGTTKVSKIVFP